MKIKILFLLFPIFVFAQIQKIKLVDIETKEPLQFVELLYNNETLFSDKNGNFFIDFNSEKIEVLDGNYKPNLMEISATTKKIELQNTVTELEELVISKKPRTIINPQRKDLTKYYYINSEMCILSELIFKHKYQNTYLRKISFKTLSELFFTSDFISGEEKKKYKNSIQILRLNVFDKDKNKIFTSDPLEFIPKKKSNFEVSIDEDILITNDPIFIEIQVLGSLDGSGSFLNKQNTVSIRPEQSKLKPNEYEVKVWYKKEK